MMNPTWLLLPSTATLCGYSYEYWLGDSSQVGWAPPHWVNLARQWVAVTLNLLKYGCSTPQPNVVANAYEQSRLILTDPTLCNVDDSHWDKYTNTLDNYNNGQYSTSGGPPHCNSKKKRSDLFTSTQPTDSDSNSNTASTAGQCCVKSADQWYLSGEYIAYAHEVVICDKTVGELIAGWQHDELRAEAAKYLNLKQCSQVTPEFASNDALRLDAMLVAANCYHYGYSDFIAMNEYTASVQAYNNGSYSDVGGPCACDNQNCHLSKQALAPQPNANFETIVYRSASTPLIDRPVMLGVWLPVTLGVGLLLGAVIALVARYGVVRFAQYRANRANKLRHEEQQSLQAHTEGTLGAVEMLDFSSAASVPGFDGASDS